MRLLPCCPPVHPRDRLPLSTPPPACPARRFGLLCSSNWICPALLCISTLFLHSRCGEQDRRGSFSNACGRRSDHPTACSRTRVYVGASVLPSFIISSPFGCYRHRVPTLFATTTFSVASLVASERFFPSPASSTWREVRAITESCRPFVRKQANNHKKRPPLWMVEGRAHTSTHVRWSIDGDSKQQKE